jgi:hypothetical protein
MLSEKFTEKAGSQPEEQSLLVFNTFNHHLHFGKKA